ncbi:uncharacterized protein LOC109543214 [Dendroctonus ponderosae]|uniref:CHK kinase-like domain-containing protein n=1 Tax=Dendroctonus ponderosae TaxID=77166 RepID=A0AAR5Q526_DENPD|nr:uncharacterized protein LOC109543214 [Dendroctonus ponderosae]
MNNVRSFFDRLRNSPILGGRRTEQILTEGSTSGLSSTIQERNVKSFLEDCFNQPVNVLNILTTEKSPANEIPVVIKITVVAKIGRSRISEDVHIIIKMLQEETFFIGDNSKLLMRLDHLTKIKKEICVFDLVMEAFIKFQKPKNIKIKNQFFNLFETCISSRVSSYESNDAKFALPDPSSAILYNDLRYDKFYFEDELLDFDYPTTQEVVKNLARMHATSVAFRLLEPERFNEEVLSVLELKERDYVVKPTFPVHLNRKLLKFCLKDSFFNIDVILADIAQYSILNWYSTISEDQEWMALCHSQYWIPNILVKRNRKRQAIASKATALHKLEFNNCCRDLAFFLFTSVEPKMLEMHFEDILRMYVKTFEWVLAIHSVPDIICAAYIYEEFLKEFDVQGPKIIYNLLTDLLQVTCDEYTEGGLPILNARYKEKVIRVLKLMAHFEWISPECRNR